VLRLRLLAAIVALILGIVLLAIGSLSPGPPRVNIRWTPQTTDSLRREVEQSLRLAAPLPRGGRTWSYQLLDTSRDNVGRILDHPAVEDRHYFGPGRTLTPEAPPVQAWLQARYGRPPASWIAAGWWICGPALLVIAFLCAWPLIRTWAMTADVRIAALLVTAALLRLRLILSGGQYFWPDEARYRGARDVAAALWDGAATSMRGVMGEPSSLLLKLVGALPATIERLTGDNPRVPALMFGCCSVLSIWLVAAIARRLDATRDEAFLAALFAAGSATLLYFSRHILSYDLALAFGLAGVWTGVSRRTVLASVLTGVWAAASFLAYAGAWPLMGAVLAVHVADAPTRSAAARRVASASCGVVATVVILILAYRGAGMSWLTLIRVYSGTITQGEFGEGWRLPFEYLWHAEHLLLIVWLAAAAWCVPHLRWAMRTRVSRAGLVGAVTIYAALAVSSTVLHRFVVYGRLTRPLIPFLCLVTAAVIGSVLNSGDARSRRRAVILATVAAATIAQAAVNFRIPFRQPFPSEFVAAIEQRYTSPVFVNARHLYPGPEPMRVPAGYREVASAPHPLQFVPYQYEGYTAGERLVLRTEDIRMRAFAPAQ